MAEAQAAIDSAPGSTLLERTIQCDYAFLNTWWESFSFPVPLAGRYLEVPGAPSGVNLLMDIPAARHLSLNPFTYTARRPFLLPTKTFASLHCIFRRLDPQKIPSRDYGDRARLLVTIVIGLSPGALPLDIPLARTNLDLWELFVYSGIFSCAHLTDAHS